MATHGLLSSDAPRLIEESAIDEVTEPACVQASPPYPALPAPPDPQLEQAKKELFCSYEWIKNVGYVCVSLTISLCLLPIVIVSSSNNTHKWGTQSVLALPASVHTALQGPRQHPF